MKEKSTDNVKMLAEQRRRANRLNSIKNGIEGGTIKEFDQMFAIITETRMSMEMGISFATFRKKCQDPTDFTVKEIIRFAALFGVKYNAMHDFLIHKVKVRSKSGVFRD